MDTLSLEELGVETDPGTEWHPDKAEARNADGLLRDLSQEEAQEHLSKPEAWDQVDAYIPLAAEDSIYTPEDEI